MKPKTIVGLVVLCGFFALLLLNFGDQVGGYMHFEEAASSGGRAHVVGVWVQEEETRYDPATNLFTFHMQDEEGETWPVQFHNPKPASFEDADKIVVEGSVEGTVFVADHILMKCPSKYNDERALEKSAPYEIEAAAPARVQSGA